MSLGLETLPFMEGMPYLDGLMGAQENHKGENSGVRSLELWNQHVKRYFCAEVFNQSKIGPFCYLVSLLMNNVVGSLCLGCVMCSFLLFGRMKIPITGGKLFQVDAAQPNSMTNCSK